MSDIVINNITKYFGEQCVFDGFSLEIKSGERCCLMGKSGSGKTTILNIVLGFLKPDSGSVFIDKKSISVVFQEDRLCEDFSAQSNIKMVCADYEKVIACLKSLGLEEHMNKPVRELSGGMKRRVAIGRALSVEADIIIMDEPFKGLDDDTKGSVIAYVKEKTEGKTFLLITHDVEEAKKLGTDIINI